MPREAETVRRAGRADSGLLASFGVQLFGDDYEALKEEFAAPAEGDEAAGFEEANRIICFRRKL